MAIKLPAQAFLALAAVGWADGQLHATEGKGLVRAARESGLSGDDLAAVEASTREKVALEAFDPGAMTEWERVVTYALASWLAQIDGVVSTDEGDTLAALGQRLSLDVAIRRRAAAVAFDISVLPEGGRPDKYDFAKLTARLRERMPGIEETPVSAPFLDSTGSIGSLLEENAFTVARLRMHRLAAPFAADFEAFQKSVARILCCDDDLGRVIESIEAAVLAEVEGDAGEERYRQFFGRRSLEEIERPVIDGHLEAVRAWLPLLHASISAPLRALAGDLERRIAAADDAILAQAGVEGTIRDFRSAGQREALIDDYNTLREGTAGKLAELPERHPDHDLPVDFAAQFFRRPAGGARAAQQSPGETVQAKIEIVAAELGGLREQLAAIEAQEQAEAALEEARRTADEAAARVAAFETKSNRKR